MVRDPVEYIGLMNCALDANGCIYTLYANTHEP